MKDYDIIIGQKLRDIRKQKRISLRTVSLKTGISHPALSNYELGKRSLYIDQLKKICNALDIDFIKFLEDIYNE